MIDVDHLKKRNDDYAKGRARRRAARRKSAPLLVRAGIETGKGKIQITVSIGVAALAVATPEQFALAPTLFTKPRAQAETAFV